MKINIFSKIICLANKTITFNLRVIEYFFIVIWSNQQKVLIILIKFFTNALIQITIFLIVHAPCIMGHIIFVSLMNEVILSF